MESVGEESGIRRLMMANNTMNDENKKKALDAKNCKSLRKIFGKGAVMKLGDPAAQVHVGDGSDRFSESGSGTWCWRRSERTAIEIYGPESSGKTTVALHMVAEVQKRGGIAGFIDAEHALDPAYAKKIGVDIDELFTFHKPDSEIRHWEITETMVLFRCD